MELNPATVDLDVLRAMRFGVRVDRDAAALPQGTAGALFTVTGGKVAILGLIGEVTTIVQTQANNTKITANPTVGTSVDICAVLDITAAEVGGQLSITGTFATALVGKTAGAAVMCATPVVVNEGTVDLDCNASNTGAVKWSMFYMPLEDGARVTAA